jgi:malate/lactate dehydrogenase
VAILAVVGAGPLGAAITHQASAAAVARRVVLVDDAADVARGLALDIRQAGPIAGSSTAVEGTGDTGAVVGASVVVVADRYGKGEWRGDDGLALVARLRTFAPGALIVCAGAAQSDVVELFVRERDGDRRRIVGSAPEALRSALTALACLETGAAPADVSLAAIGRPPKEMFVPWEGAAIGGSRAADVLPAAVIARLDRQVPYLWPPGPLALAGAAVRVARLVLLRAPGWVNVFLVPPVTNDRQVRGVAVPAVVDDGALAPVWPVLAPRDRVRLESALAG